MLQVLLYAKRQKPVLSCQAFEDRIAHDHALVLGVLQRGIGLIRVHPAIICNPYSVLTAFCVQNFPATELTNGRQKLSSFSKAQSLE